MTRTQINRELKSLIRSLRKVYALKGNPKLEKLVAMGNKLAAEIDKLYAEVSAIDGTISTPVGPANPVSEPTPS